MRGESEAEWGEVFGKSPAAEEEPDVEDEGEDERFCSRFLEFVDACFRSEGCHCHGEKECVDVVDYVDNGNGQEVE